MTDFPIFLYTSSSEIPTLSYTWSLKKIPFKAEPPGIGIIESTPPRNSTSYFTLFAKGVFASWNSKYNCPVLLCQRYLGIKTVSCGLLMWTARMDMDWNLKKFAQLLFYAYNEFRGWCFLVKFVWYLFDNSKRAGIFCMDDGAKKCLQLRIDLKQQYPRDKAPLSLLLNSIKSPISSTNTVKFRK